MEELGQGAFGKVHKGILRDQPKLEVFFKPKEERVEIKEGKVVAIKVLLGEQNYAKKKASFITKWSSTYFTLLSYLMWIMISKEFEQSLLFLVVKRAALKKKCL